MSFFGIGKKKLDEQSREEQSAETAKVQKEQASEDAPKNARLSQKIMEQQQWEDSLRRFVKSESARHQNHDEEQNEEHRAVEDLKRALLHGDEKVEESSAADELTEEQERRSMLAALGTFPQESEEPVEAEQVAEGQDVEEDAAPVAEAAQPATPAFLRDDEETEAEGASVEAKESSSADVEEPKDAAENARSQFEEHLRALRAQNTEVTAAEVAEATASEAEGGEELEVVEAVGEAADNKSKSDYSASESVAEDSLTVEDLKTARTRAAVTEAQNAGLDDLAAAYAARLGITLDSDEETFGEVASDEVIAEEATADTPEIFEVAETEETVDLTAALAEDTEPVTAAEEEQIEAVVEAPELLASELTEEENSAEEPVESAVTLAVPPKERALYSLTELMHTRGSGTMSLELRHVDEDMHYRLLHRGREVETGIVVPGVDWFAPVAALYTEAQQAGATWNRAAVSLKPHLGDGLEVHASYLGAADGQTISESFLLEGSAVEAKSVATAEVTSQDEPQEAAVQSVDSVEAEREAIERKLEAERAEKQAANEAEATVEVAEEPVIEAAEEDISSGLLTAAGLAAAAGSAVAASVQEKEDAEEAVEASDEPAQTEFAPVEADFEYDYENDPVFGAATVESETEQAEELTAEPSEISEASVHESDESGEDMEAALAAIVANAQKKLNTEDAAAPAVAEETPAEDVSAEDVSAVAPLAAESFTVDRTQPVEEAAEEPAVEQTEEPALPAFLDDSELLPEPEASVASAEAYAEEPALENVESAAESASVAPGLAGALVAAAAVGTAGAAAKATEAKAAGVQEEPAEKVAELKTVEVTPAAKIAEAPATVASASEATAQATPAAPVADAAPAVGTIPVALQESTPAGISSSISASALSEHNQLPTIVAEPDTPSVAVQSPLAPSETQLASGNLVLTQTQVAQRLAPVVEHLFGENGTAKDATTVLIRVRALGSYYDALTHVRRNGFWEQVRTFELIPETLLDIPALKTDSYSEGEGSPLAMSLTFTPGVPVQAAFDYANEQAFVTYPRPLDAERYVEELRMFPRLGSKIPAHMTSALSHWNL